MDMNGFSPQCLNMIFMLNKRPAPCQVTPLCLDHVTGLRVAAAVHSTNIPMDSPRFHHLQGMVESAPTPQL